MKKTFNFLTMLAKNNDRDWMQANKKIYEEAKFEFNGLVENLIREISVFDKNIDGLKPKDCIFRLHRDVRFSNDKSPYKTNFGAAITPGGRKTGNPTYYIHLEPGKSMIAGGVYMPEAENLKKIRQEIDYNPDGLKKILEDNTFKKTFVGIKGEELKTAPKGYPKDHVNIELLRFKSYTVFTALPDTYFTGDELINKLAGIFKIIYPLNQYLSVAIS